MHLLKSIGRSCLMFTALSAAIAACGSSGSGTSGENGGGNASAGEVGLSGSTGSVGVAGTAGRGEPGQGGAAGSSAAGSANSAGSSGSSAGQTGGGSGGAATVNGGAGGSSGGTNSGGTNSGGTSTGGTSTGGGSAGTGTGGASVLSSGCGKMPTIASSQYNNGHHITITAAGLQREYILNVPTNYDNTHPYKFVIAYHELNGNDDEMYKNNYFHLLPLSNNSTIFVAPNGQQSGKNCTSAGGCGWPNPNDSDMLFADAVVAQVEQNFCVDTNRIFATGWSYGASMSYETACERPLGGMTNGVPGYIRSIAVYSVAQLSGSCKPAKPVAYYASHGTSDATLNYSLGLGLLQNMEAVDGCTSMTPTKVTSGNHVCTNFLGCSAGYPVEFCSFNGPHTPDPKDPGQQTSWEYQNAWAFLNQF